MRRTAALVVAAALLALPEAGAKPSDPAVMRASGGQQRGALLHFTETSRTSGGKCAVRHGDGQGEGLAAVAHDGSALVWRLRDARRPTRVTVYRRRYVAPGVRVSIEPTEELDTRLRAVRSGRRVVAWEVVSEPVGDGEQHLDVTATWRGACGDDSAAYLFLVNAS
jgi:hypothetical protein